jgi:hypothetical protein
MADFQFDVEGARSAGFTDQQIADRLAKEAGFDSVAARAAGFKDQDIIGRLIGASKPATSAPVAEPEIPGIGQTMLIGAGRTFDRIGKGAQQLYDGATGNEKASAELAERAKADDETYAPLQKARPFSTGIGEALPSMAIPIGGTATVPMTLAKLGAAGAAPELLKYGSAQDRLTNAGMAGASAAAGGYVLPKAAQMIKGAGASALKGVAGEVSPEAWDLYQKAQAQGIPVNVAQLGDSRFMKTLASTLEQLPFTGAAKSNQAQQKAYVRAISRTFGDDTDAITSDVYRANRTRLGSTFEALSARNSLKVTPDVVQRLESVVENARKFANADTEKSIQSIVSQYVSRIQGGKVPATLSSLVDTNGAPIVMKKATETALEVPGKAYQSLDSQISKLRKAGGEKAVYLAEIQNITRDAMDASISPADQAAWKTAREQYRNLKLVRDVIARDGGNGEITPMAMMTALNRSEGGKEIMAQGLSGTTGDLAKIGKQFIRDPIPNSGTIQRGAAMGLLGGAGIAFGMDVSTLGGLTLGSATSGRLINKAINSPKVIDAMNKPALTLKDILLTNPSAISQVGGAGLGMSVNNSQEVE